MKSKKIALLIALTLMFSFISENVLFAATAHAASSSAEATLTVGDKVTLDFYYNGKKISGKKVTYTISKEGKKIGSVSKSGVFTAKKAGKVTVKGTYKKNTVKWKITVKKVKSNYTLNGIKFNIPDNCTLTNEYSDANLAVFAINNKYGAILSVYDFDQYKLANGFDEDAEITLEAIKELRQSDFYKDAIKSTLTRAGYNGEAAEIHEPGGFINDLYGKECFYGSSHIYTGDYDENDEYFYRIIGDKVIYLGISCTDGSDTFVDDVFKTGMSLINSAK